MMDCQYKLYMLMIGCTPPGRFTEQHDIFFGIATSMAELASQLNDFWPEANGELHIDAWRTVTRVDDYQIQVIEKSGSDDSQPKLFFINLGGYKFGEFEEYHYKHLTVADSLSMATKTAKQTAFYKHCGFKGATSHIDDKYGIDVDDAYNIEDMLSLKTKVQFALKITKTEDQSADTLHIGYLTLKKMKTINQ